MGKIAAAITIAFLISCSAPRKMQETNLYFGQTKLTGDTVTAKEWDDFVKQHISSVFADGSTIIRAAGNWYDTAAKQVYREPTYMVIAIHPKNKAYSNRIDDLRNLYKTLYHQQSVLRVDKKVRFRLF